METLVGEGFPVWVQYLLAGIVGAKVVTTFTPTKVDDAVLGKVMSFINVMALNIGKAKNADDKDTKAAKVSK